MRKRKSVFAGETRLRSAQGLVKIALCLSPLFSLIHFSLVGVVVLSWQPATFRSRVARARVSIRVCSRTFYRHLMPSSLFSILNFYIPSTYFPLSTNYFTFSASSMR